MSEFPADPVARAETAVADARAALTTTAQRLRLRLDPRLIVADVAQRTVGRSLQRIVQSGVTPKQRRRQIAVSALAFAAAVGMRVWFRQDKRTHDAKALSPPEK